MIYFGLGILEPPGSTRRPSSSARWSRWPSAAPGPPRAPSAWRWSASRSAWTLSLGLAAGAIISGAYFGDKMSPLSDTTNLAPAMAATDLFTHIRHMLWTTVAERRHRAAAVRDHRAERQGRGRRGQRDRAHAGRPARPSSHRAAGHAAALVLCSP
jgi:hypothetical protein